MISPKVTAMDATQFASMVIGSDTVIVGESEYPYPPSTSVTVSTAPPLKVAEIVAVVPAYLN